MSVLFFWITVAALLLLCGSLVGALLAHASQGGAEQHAVVSPLYASDLIGGAVGALLGSLVAIPLLGLAATAEAVAALSLAALVLV
jgi:predicted membrane-bound spermidine synthase